jgi:hypothetical protein
MRIYSQEYICYEFTYIIEENVQKSLCVICSKSSVLCNDSIRPAKLREHLFKCYPGYLNSTIEQFVEIKNRLALSFRKTWFKRIKSSAITASYFAARCIANNKKIHTIAENLIKPRVLKIVELVCGKSQIKEIEKNSIFQ